MTPCHLTCPRCNFHLGGNHILCGGIFLLFEGNTITLSPENLSHYVTVIYDLVIKQIYHHGEMIRGWGVLSLYISVKFFLDPWGFACFISSHGHSRAILRYFVILTVSCNKSIGKITRENTNVWQRTCLLLLIWFPLTVIMNKTKKFSRFLIFSIFLLFVLFCRVC